MQDQTFEASVSFLMDDWDFFTSGERFKTSGKDCGMRANGSSFWDKNQDLPSGENKLRQISCPST